MLYRSEHFCFWCFYCFTSRPFWVHFAPLSATIGDLNTQLTLCACILCFSVQVHVDILVKQSLRKQVFFCSHAIGAMDYNRCTLRQAVFYLPVSLFFPFSLPSSLSAADEPSRCSSFNFRMNCPSRFPSSARHFVLPKRWCIEAEVTTAEQLFNCLWRKEIHLTNLLCQVGMTLRKNFSQVFS